MIFSFLIRWASSWIILFFANRLITEISLPSPYFLVITALILAIFGTALTYLLTPFRSLSTLLLIDLFLYALLLLGLSTVFPLFLVSNSAALTVSLFLTGFEWLFRRISQLPWSLK
ncbi:hypothetical protein SAMN05444487_103102 [Marininema mesophilum]|uniref:Uncharacterized protein n=1 Tax=Marininema mesophilum TaxID=1048340 RepID=A0A1H2TFH0_9BACL|nr:hypothetical protein [Marininema mesophilum]SDW42024.1 hypothetical protein SAMN05444487_103102 [Marininema mesophilum]